jgi:hypothetical protein
MGIHNSLEEAKQLSPSDFYVNVVAKMPPQTREFLDKLKLVKVSVASSTMLPDGRPYVELSFTVPPNRQPNKAVVKLKLSNAQWKVQIGL